MIAQLRYLEVKLLLSENPHESTASLCAQHRGQQGSEGHPPRSEAQTFFLFRELRGEQWRLKGLTRGGESRRAADVNQCSVGAAATIMAVNSDYGCGEDGVRPQQSRGHGCPEPLHHVLPTVSLLAWAAEQGSRAYGAGGSQRCLSQGVIFGSLSRRVLP